MTYLEPDCKEALEKHCLDNGADPSDPHLIDLARLVCGAEGADSLGSWLAPQGAKRALLEALAAEHGSVDSDALALAEELLVDGESIEYILARVGEAIEGGRSRDRGDGQA